MNAIVQKLQRRRGFRAFSRSETLVVLCVLVVLFTITVVLISGAHQNAKASECQNNIRHLVDALLKYANDNNSGFPPNFRRPSPEVRWSDANRIVPYLHFPDQSVESSSSRFVCPADMSASISYSMNFWASSMVDSTYTSQTPKTLMWNAVQVRHPSQMILLAESWSYVGSSAAGFKAPPTLGHQGITAGQRFGGGTGITPFDAGRFGMVNCELAYNRHRDHSASAIGTQPHGRVVMALADGHVELVSDSQAVDLTGQSTGIFRWTTADLP